MDQKEQLINPIQTATEMLIDRLSTGKRGEIILDGKPITTLQLIAEANKQLPKDKKIKYPMINPIY